MSILQETVLVVDDTKINLVILDDILKEKYIVALASNADIALSILKNTRIDIILLDIVMPNIDGFKFCKIIKSDTNIKDIPIIFLSANDSVENIEKAYTLGGVDYLTKPIKAKEILSCVKKFLT